MKTTRKLPRDRVLVVCDGDACRKAGSRDLIKQIKSELKGAGKQKQWQIVRCSCLDECDDAGLAMALPSGRCYRGLKPKHAKALIEQEEKEPV